MLIGILTDSHGDQQRTRRALNVLSGRKVDAVIHCGDLGHGCVELLAEAGVPAYAVAGNTDTDPVELAMQAAEAGVRFDPQLLIVPIGDGRTLAVTHGNDPMLMADLFRSEKHAYVLHGHTHRVRNEKVGATRLINSGALSRIAQPMIAVLDTATDQVEFLPLTGK
jgi:uncharacterized protein